MRWGLITSRRWLGVLAGVVVVSGVGGTTLAGGSPIVPGATAAGHARHPRNGRIVYALETKLPSGAHRSAIYTMSRTGSDVRRLVMQTFPAGQDPADLYNSPRWSPDGKKIAFLEGNGTQPSQLWVMNADGSHRHAVIRSSQNVYIDGGLSWAPGGRRIAFSENGNSSTNWVGVTDGRIGGLAGGNGGSADPTFSHSGKWIVGNEGADGDPDHPLFIARPYRMGQRRLTVGAGPSWSPDDTRIMYTRTTYTAARGNRDRIWTIRFDGTKRRAVFPPNILASGGQYSPDGHRVLYVRIGPKLGSIWAANLNGTHRQQLSMSYPNGIYQGIWGFDGQPTR